MTTTTTATATDLPNPAPPARALSPQQARQWAMACHLAALVGFFGNGLGFLLGPLAVWLIKRNDDPLIDTHGKRAMNFQLTLLCTAVAALPVCFLLVWLGGTAKLAFLPILLFFVTFAFLALVLPIVAAVRVSNGQDYQYPISIPFLK